MTLKDYTYFVIKFSRLPIPQSSCTQAWHEFESTVQLDLGKLLGQLRWREFVDAFMKKTHWQGEKHFKWSEFGPQVMKNWTDFLHMLAEFCEPLIGKEEPKGGQG